MANHQNERQSSASSDKLLGILECIAANRTPVRLQDLAEQSGMTQPTVLRYLRTLQNGGYVYQDEDTLRYALTWKLCGLTDQLNSFIGLRNIAAPFVNELGNTLHLGVCLVVNRDHQCVYLDCIDNPRAREPLQYIGKRAPLHVTGSGKLLLSGYSDARIDEFIALRGLEKYTEHTITTKEALVRQLDEVRKQGFAYDNEECEIGLRCVSYPLRCYTGEIYAAISVFGNASEMTDAFLEKEVQPRLQAVAETISVRLGYDKNEK